MRAEVERVHMKFQFHKQNGLLYCSDCNSFITTGIHSGPSIKYCGNAIRWKRGLAFCRYMALMDPVLQLAIVESSPQTYQEEECLKHLYGYRNSYVEESVS